MAIHIAPVKGLLQSSSEAKHCDCRIGANVKILNSLIMDEVVIGDNAHIQNSVIGQKSVIGTKAQLKDCFVAHERHVRENADHRDEQLATGAPQT